jgi:hypothetical protein
LVEALQKAFSDDQSIAGWLLVTERQLPQRARELYSQLSENDLQLPELMDFKRSIVNSGKSSGFRVP